jgi:hypothetical protein
MAAVMAAILLTRLMKRILQALLLGRDLHQKQQQLAGTRTIRRRRLLSLVYRMLSILLLMEPQRWRS